MIDHAAERGNLRLTAQHIQNEDEEAFVDDAPLHEALLVIPRF
jgi:hypothetical protein